MITDQDIGQVQYFWQKRGNLDSWTEWEEKKPFFEVEYPELVRCWNDYKIAEQLLNILIEHLGE